MGSAASINIPLGEMSSAELSSLICSIGSAYEPYGKLFIDNGISGEVLGGFSSSADIKSLLSGIGITNPVHSVVLCQHFAKLSGSSTPSAAAASATTIDWSPPEVNLTDRVTRTPRDLLSELFQIQGVTVDPTDIDTALEKIKKSVGNGFGDGVSKFDCFINYRVAADRDLAEKLFYSLKSMGVHPFLDSMCLKSGMNWKEGFLHGLKHSRYFIAVISTGALARVRDMKKNHSEDSVLLEYETALKVMKQTGNKKYILPLHVAAVKGSVIVKFSDFDPTLYPDSLLPNWKAIPAKQLIEEVARMQDEELVTYADGIFECISSLALQPENLAMFGSEEASFWCKIGKSLDAKSMKEGTAEKALLAVERLGAKKGDVEGCARQMIEEGYCSLVVAILSKFGKGSPEVAEAGCAACVALMSVTDSNASGAPSCSRGHSIPWHSNHRNRVCDLCRSAAWNNCSCGYDLCDTCYQNNMTSSETCKGYDQLRAQGLLDVAVDLLRTHAAHVDAVNQGVWVLRLFSKYEDNIGALLASHVEFLVGLLREHAMGDAEYAGRALVLLYNLVIRGEQAAIEEVGRTGGIELALDILRKFGASDEVMVDRGLWFFKKLATHEPSKAKMRCYGITPQA